eukprot:c6626_g1_i2.p1 GENE.c6626_g1_i2~~c6626_g1_i2.p1  ORF type:complete len:306 (+),score=48.67 c6626_g1_i2:200-1117(+)
MTQFWFGLYNMLSGQSLYESWTQSSFNVFFTALPIIAYGVLDQDVCMKGLLNYPSIFQVGQKKLLFNARMFAYWLCNAIWHSVVCFLIPLYLSLYIVAEDGQERGLYGMGMFTYTGVVYVCCGKVLLMTRTHNWITFGAVVLSILAWFLWLLVYSYVVLEASQLTIWRLGYYVLDLPSWWLCTILVPVAALSRDFAWRSYKDLFMASPVVYANWINHHNLWDQVEKENKKAAAKTVAEMTPSARRTSAVATLRTMNSGLGFAFASSDRAPNSETDWERLKHGLDEKSKNKRPKPKREKSNTEQKM